MRSTLRRLAAGVVLAGSLAAFAAPAEAHVYCYEFTFANGYFHGCI